LPACFPLDDQETTLAEMMSMIGYRTAAVVANYGFVSDAYGLDQGFQHWFATPPRRSTPILVSIGGKTTTEWSKHLVSETVPYRRASDIREVALRWVRQYGDRPFFLFINFMDPHLPYSPPEPWDRFVEGKIRHFGPEGSEINDLRAGKISFSKEQWRHIRSQYDGEIAYVDSEMGKFFEALDEEGYLSGSIIVITSDHGEFLGEMGLLDHQIGLYEPVIRVPLIIKPASETPLPSNTARLVQTTDIVPTILDLLGIAIPSSVQGTSLWRDGTHRTIAQHYVDDHVLDWYGGRFSEDQVALIEGHAKFIYSRNDGEELYDLQADWEEKHNLAHVHPGIAEAFREAIQEWIASVDVTDRQNTLLPEIDEATSRKLEALGYVN
jgi:arylsulfatase A-like enzyme